MKIAILSLFRNAAHNGQIERYCVQMDSLQTLLHKQGHTLHLLMGYGDSVDDTGEMLFEECANRFDTHLIDVSHGGKVYVSIEHPTRFKQLAYCGNKLLDNVPPDADVVGIVESDLCWDAQTISDLIAQMYYHEGIAPMVMDGPDSFYDIFAFRRNGQRFTKTPPYHPDLDRCCESVLELDSAGSVLFVRGDLARKARLTDGEAIVGFCKDIYRLGGSIWLDTALSVQHPPFGGAGRSRNREADHQGRVRI